MRYICNIGARHHRHIVVRLRFPLHAHQLVTRDVTRCLLVLLRWLCCVVNCREIVVTMSRGQCLRVALIGGRGDGQCLVELVTQSERQAHVLLLVLQREGGRELAAHHRRPLQREHWVRDRPQAQHLQQIGLAQARSVSQRHALAKCTHHGPHDHVDNQLHLGPRPHGAEVERLLAHRGEGELTFLEQRRVARSHNHQLTLDGWPLAAGHRCLQETTSRTRDSLAYLRGGGGINSGHVHI
mmetsp:Transcript_22238/g.37163  ORF Transcript_22238/g.37163 Transcript_22238/m.37163 type:complete len:240 (-) Transcript_22238:375-1094(-)